MMKVSYYKRFEIDGEVSVSRQRANPDTGAVSEATRWT